MKYRVLTKEYSTRPFRIALKLWWYCEIEPFYNKLYSVQKNGVKYSFYVFMQPFIKNTWRYISTGEIKDSWYQFLPRTK